MCGSSDNCFDISRIKFHATVIIFMAKNFKHFIIAFGFHSLEDRANELNRLKSSVIYLFGAERSISQNCSEPG